MVTSVKNLFLALLALVGLPCASAQTSTGTAFSVAPQLLITNHHVIYGCRSVSVVTPEGRRVASVVSSNASIDLALLRVFGMRGPVASLRNPSKVALGEAISVFGFPLAGMLSSSGNFTGGLVSSLQGLRNAAGEIQITAPVQPGNSGGPVMDSSGLVVGVVQSKLNAVRAAAVTGDIPQNVNFAVAPDVLADFLEVNQVPFRSSTRGVNKDTAEIAKMAQQFTYRVECEGATPLSASPGSTPPNELAPTPNVSADENLVFAWPHPGQVLANFDEAKNKGLDFGGKAGDPVLAAADGKVDYAGAGLRGYGNLVILKHNNTYLTAYAHNQTLLVKEDQAIQKGQKIAEMGNSDADSVKLHFEIRRLGKPVDPIKYLPARP
jgi:murein DD-endopeptidase MepM/ murein hydrolase activator NlpD